MNPHAIPFEEAYRLCMDSSRVLPSENVPLSSSPGRILAEDVFSDTDMPPFNKSAVDGFACRMSDIKTQNIASFRNIETIPAGKIPQTVIGPGQCAKIMTGAMVPEGADAVIMVEDTETLPGGQIRYTGGRSAPNICYRGEDVRKGALVLGKGTRIRPQEVAVLASVGKVSVSVYGRPSVCVVSTGDELVEPGTKPPPGRIRNSNGWQTLAQLGNRGVQAVYAGIVSDEVSVLRRILGECTGKFDITILSGGVSMGDFDYVPQVLSEQGCEIVFKSVAVQPGRPTLFAKKNGALVFGLPGNPVSSFVLFELLVAPFLMKCTGGKEEPLFTRFQIAAEYTRKRSGRMSLVPVRIINGRAAPVEYHGSAHIQAYTDADGIMKIPAGTVKIEEGEPVDVRLL